MGGARSHDDRMDTLEQLIKRVMHDSGLSYRELARRDTTGGVTYGRLNQIVRDGIDKFPEPQTIAGIAKALRCTQQEVIHAAARSLGLQVVADPVPSVTDAIGRDPYLLPEAKQHLTTQYGLLLRVQGPSDASAGTEPGTEEVSGMSAADAKVADLDIAKRARRQAEERKRGGRT